MRGVPAGPIACRPDRRLTTVHRDNALAHNHYTRAGRGLVWLLPVLLLTACLPRFRQPDIRLDAVRLGRLGLEGGTLYAGLIVANPNTYELRASTLAFSLELQDAAGSSGDWVRIARGSVDRDVSIAAGDSAAIEIPVDFTYAGVGTAIRSVLSRGLLDYRLAGDLGVTRPISRTVPFRRTGQVNLTTRN